MRSRNALFVALLAIGLFDVEATKPNFVFILTDDQDMQLGTEDVYTQWGSVAAQPKVQRRLLDNGTAMENFFVNTPICCPSRTEFFTGRYFHNVRGVNGTGCMHVDTGNVSDQTQGLFGQFIKNGYNVGIFGKVTNDQLPQLEHIVAQRSASYISSPIDYNNYFGLTYFNYNASAGDVKGTTETLDKDSPKYGTAYQTTQIGNRTAVWLAEVLLKEQFPFFLYLGPHAPHYPADPAPWYEGKFAEEKAPRTPNYNVASPDKTPHIRQNGAMTDVMQCWEDEHFRDRWRTLVSVDDLVDFVFTELDAYHQTENTYVIYTSDHGYKLGQWRVPTSKEHPYETDIRVPLFISGPGIAPKTVLPQITGNVDLLPTLLELAGITTDLPDNVDGKEFASVLLGKDVKKDRRTAWLNEYQSVGTYWSDHSNMWTPQGFDCGGPLPSGPAGAVAHNLCVEQNTTGTGNCYYVDSEKSNTFRSLRRLNETHNTTYVEYNSAWEWCPTCPIHREYYNVTADPYQMHNLYTTLSEEVKAALVSELNEYSACMNEECP